MDISDRDFTLLLQFIETETGIALPDTNYRNVKLFLADRLTACQLDTGRYLELLKINDAEYDRFISAITINETYFFREEKHFTLLDNEIIPEISGLETRIVNIWSAACSTGEEAISLAALLHKHKNRLTGKICTVYATDINPNVLSFFKKGCYKKNSFRSDGEKYAYLLALLGKEQDGMLIPGAEIMNQIRIARMNLYSEHFDELPSRFQIIFLRNTLLYMRIETRLWIIDHLVKKLADNGCLFLSTSETALIAHPELQLEERDNVYFFRKKNSLVKRGEPYLLKRSLRKTIRQAATFYTDADRKDKQALTINDIAVIIDARINNVFFKDDLDIKVQAALGFIEIIKNINAGKFETAREKLKALEEKILPNELVCYFYGYLDMLAGNIREASIQFRKSILLNNSFWLARFYLAKLLALESVEQARREFLLCRKYMERYIEKDNQYLQFLLEDFNVRYFRALCDKWLDNNSVRDGQ